MKSLAVQLTHMWDQFCELRAKRRLYNQTVRELDSLTDRELKDLGITRGMIRSIAMESHYDNQNIAKDQLHV